jgi:hypothetical protein
MTTLNGFNIKVRPMKQSMKPTPLNAQVCVLFSFKATFIILSADTVPYSNIAIGVPFSPV